MSNFANFTEDYFEKLRRALALVPLKQLEILASEIRSVWNDGRQLYIFGNGGSAGNAIHLANDYLYGIGKKKTSGLKVHALPANTSILTCLANDEGYEKVFVEQLKTYAISGDVALAFSGSGNSPNIIEALTWCNENGVKTFGILGYSGGKAKDLCDTVIHTPVNDMQISEDLQIIVGHVMMQWLSKENKSQ